LINDGVTSREHYSIYIHDENKFTKNKKKTSCRKGVYLQLPMTSVSVTTKVVSSNPDKVCQ